MFSINHADSGKLPHRLLLVMGTLHCGWQLQYLCKSYILTDVCLPLPLLPGVASRTYGLAANPCKPCSTGLEITSTSASGHTDPASGGIIDAAACVTKPGWGWDGRISTECPKGSWAVGGDLSPCTECGFGLTTVGTATNASASCLLAEGYGSVSGVLQLCPIGELLQLLLTYLTTFTCMYPTIVTDNGCIDSETDLRPQQQVSYRPQSLLMLICCYFVVFPCLQAPTTTKMVSLPTPLLAVLALALKQAQKLVL